MAISEHKSPIWVLKSSLNTFPFPEKAISGLLLTQTDEDEAKTVLSGLMAFPAQPFLISDCTL